MDGILLIDKPAGITSAEAVRRIKSRVKPSRVGHLGTLDPFATGLLPILIGEATKLATFLEEADKEYRGAIRFGSETDTLDLTGTITRTAPLPTPDSIDLDSLRRKFTGPIEQTPPIFSAIKRGGVPLYKMARRGEKVAPPSPRRVEIKRFDLEVAAPDLLRFSVVCSPGTYLRSLARDVGAALGTAAHLAELSRIRTCGFELAKSSSLDSALEALAAGTAPLVGLRESLVRMPEVQASADVARRIGNGDSTALTGLVPFGGNLFKLIFEGNLLAVCRADSMLTAKIERAFLNDRWQSLSR
jgi:tRNA pseudouridine55 synthase